MKSIDAKHFLIDVSFVREGVESLDAYPFCLPAVRGLGKLVFHPAVTFLLGENGSGKSTLIEALAIALGLNPEGGSRNFHFATRQSHSGLHEHLRVAKGLRRPRDSYFLRAESFFNVATEIERLNEPRISAAYGERPLHDQSHGESFLALFKHCFKGSGLYLLDEPEAALSPSRQLSFLTLLDALVERGAQFVIATHSPIILGYPRATLFQLASEGVEKVEYRETEHYQLTRDFLNSPELYLKRLLPSEQRKSP